MAMACIASFVDQRVCSDIELCFGKIFTACGVKKFSFDNRNQRCELLPFGNNPLCFFNIQSLQSRTAKEWVADIVHSFVGNLHGKVMVFISWVSLGISIFFLLSVLAS
jgi:hypothetical protein